RGGAPKGAINLSAPDGAPLPLTLGKRKGRPKGGPAPSFTGQRSVGSAGYLTIESDGLETRGLRAFFAWPRRKRSSTNEREARNPGAAYQFRQFRRGPSRISLRSSGLQSCAG